MSKQFWNFKNISNSEAELTVYGYISMESSWFFDTVTSKQFAKELSALGNVKKITVKINSGGGDVFAAHAIYSLLKENSAKIITVVEGIAASAASVILMAGDEIIVPSTGFVMIHNPSTFASGEAKDFIKMAETLEVIKNGILNAYVERTGKTKEEISKMMDEETWLTGEDAVREGFADSIEKEDLQFSNGVMNQKMLIVNSISHDLSSFKNFPSEKLKIKNSTENDSLILPIRVPMNENSLEPLNIQHENQNTPKEVKKIMNLEQLLAEHPNLVAEIQNVAKEEGRKEERARIKEIEEISNSISAELVKKAKFEEPVNAERLAFLALQNNAQNGKKYLNDAMDDANLSGGEAVTPSPEIPKNDEEPKTITDKIKNLALIFDKNRRGVNE